jgi:hypothetical protein
VAAATAWQKEGRIRKDKKQRRETHMPVIAGIVIALMLIGLFALLMLMPDPMPALLYYCQNHVLSSQR